MLKDLSLIKLQGANFSSETDLPVLDSSDEKYSKISLIYGRNGAGKSTIAKSFRKIKGEDFSSAITATPLDSAKQTITLSETEKASIYVFDEDYVTKNVCIVGNKLESIVMLGEQADLTAQIEQAESELEQAEALVKSTKDRFEEYQTSTNPKAPQYYINKIHDILQRDDGWAGRDSKARGLRHNSRVNDDTYKRFINLSPTKSKDELIVEFSNKMKELEDAKKGTTKIVAIVPAIPSGYKEYSVSSANELIKKKIEEPRLSTREQYLLSLVNEGKAKELNERIDHLRDEKTTFCPYCLKDLTQDYKRDLVTKIEQVLSDEVKCHQTELQSQTTNDLNLELSSFSSLSSYQECVNLVTKINSTIQSNNALLNQKICVPFSPIVDKELSEIDELINKLDKALASLEVEKETHNSNAVNTKPIVDALISINDQIAYYDVIDFSKQLDEQTNEKLSVKKECDDAISDMNQKSKNLDELNGRRKRIDIAIDIINNGLKYIFFTENRLAIERDGDFYKLLSNGQPVPPKNVSVGERNIIGLCYFFTSIMKGKNRDTAYNDEYLLVIDDPISSFDFENKIGILSFLKYKLGQFLNGNPTSRAIVTTHDLLTLFDLEKICNELSAEWKRIFSGQATKYNLLELKNCALKRFEYKRQEYTELVKMIYRYGCGDGGEYDIVIGNIMRQALEAFATFEYKKGIIEVSTDETILSRMCPEHKSYFKNLMYRIVLNNGSHREEQTQSLGIDFLSVISETEKRRTAQEIICFIYLLNKEHMLAHLGNVSSTLDRWCNEIKAKAAVI